MKINNKIFSYISNYWNCSIDELLPQTTLDDIGMYGDDKLDFIKGFVNEFQLDLTHFSFEKYIDDEGGGFLRNLLFGNKLRKIEPISIEMLIKCVDLGIWKDKNI